MRVQPCGSLRIHATGEVKAWSTQRTRRYGKKPTVAGLATAPCPGAPAPCRPQFTWAHAMGQQHGEPGVHPPRLLHPVAARMRNGDCGRPRRSRPSVASRPARHQPHARGVDHAAIKRRFRRWHVGAWHVCRGFAPEGPASPTGELPPSLGLSGRRLGGDGPACPALSAPHAGTWSMAPSQSSHPSAGPTRCGPAMQCPHSHLPSDRGLGLLRPTA